MSKAANPPNGTAVRSTKFVGDYPQIKAGLAALKELADTLRKMADDERVRREELVKKAREEMPARETTLQEPTPSEEIKLRKVSIKG